MGKNVFDLDDEEDFGSSSRSVSSTGTAQSPSGTGSVSREELLRQQEEQKRQEARRKEEEQRLERERREEERRQQMYREQAQREAEARKRYEKARPMTAEEKRRKLYEGRSNSNIDDLSQSTEFDGGAQWVKTEDIQHARLVKQMQFRDETAEAAASITDDPTMFSGRPEWTGQKNYEEFKRRQRTTFKDETVGAAGDDPDGFEGRPAWSSNYDQQKEMRATRFRDETEAAAAQLGPRPGEVADPDEMFDGIPLGRESDVYEQEKNIRAQRFRDETSDGFHSRQQKFGLDPTWDAEGYGESFYDFNDETMELQAKIATEVRDTMYLDREDRRKIRDKGKKIPWWQFWRKKK